jgi:hypothetical protein
VQFFDTDLELGHDWDGLYIVCAELGPGIAVNSSLPIQWQVWVLAHELGHHFDDLQSELFSPFGAIAHSDKKVQDGWGVWRKVDPVEVRANKWAASQLIKPDEWEDAELQHPCSLRNILHRLSLPLPAALTWERIRRERFGREEVFVPLDGQQMAVLGRAVSGNGGHQSFFRRVLKEDDDNGVYLTRSDFSLARERALRDAGGGKTRYEAILRAMSPLIESAGGIGTLFEGESFRGQIVPDQAPWSQLHFHI